MLNLVDILSGANGFWKGLRSDDDFYDRLSHRYTALIFMVFAVLLSTKQYVGDAIVCWVPGHFSGSYTKYADNYCWIKNTYYMPFQERIPDPDLPRAHINYYQWVTIVLLLQSLLFYVPTIFWRLMSGSTGIDAHLMVQSLNTQANLNPENRKGVMKFLVRHMERYCNSSRDYQKGVWSNVRQGCAKYCLAIGKRYGNYLITLFLFCKFLYVTNAILQLFLLNAFLGTAYHVYGFDVIYDLINNHDWTSSGRFPRVTLCDFKIRQLGGNIHRHTVQCVLPINLFNEKVYIFIWFWLVFVSAATVFGFLTWMSMLFKNEQKHFIRKNLKLMDRLKDGDHKETLKRFIYDYLRKDGIFVLKLIGRNCNDVIVAEMIATLWDHFKAKVEGPLNEDEREEKV
ncbi:innexin unc-9 [Lingula anatina]|uniref:Innexin n=2 Tax=Lingula anatina TaxID=7574 RepID=A0A1S3JY69_LINAN|nr:innexin unc-9 [Lingula anatina]|eukprot:XP_013415360.1 innexin unc-9 [Lingula anatina]